MAKSNCVSKNPTVKMGMLTASLLDIFFCLKFMKSATISLADRNAVSPEVIGAATTPSMAKMPPSLPSVVSEITFTTQAASF